MSEITVLPAPDLSPETTASRGVGSRMIAYMQRTYKSTAPAPKPTTRVDAYGQVRTVTPHTRGVCTVCGKAHTGTGTKCVRCYEDVHYANGDPRYICPVCKGRKTRESRLCKTCTVKERWGK